jgi:hypothetical protein
VSVRCVFARQTSVTTSSAGLLCLIARTADCTGPSDRRRSIRRHPFDRVDQTAARQARRRSSRRSLL